MRTVVRDYFLGTKCGPTKTLADRKIVNKETEQVGEKKMAKARDRSRYESPITSITTDQVSRHIDYNRSGVLL